MNLNVKTDPIRTVLTITVGFLVIYMITHQPWALWVALVIGAIGVFSTWLAEKIDWLWMKLAWLLSLVVPNIVLSLIFYLFLFPIALLARIFGQKDPLLLKNNVDTVFRKVDKAFTKASFENPW
ncbi:MAG: hypothetical protein SFV52_14970 [Saprospiraceae bacterium]|nr:hypothetical protein [Saprospiraceae bacterium]